MVETGYDRVVPPDSAVNGIEITREMPATARLGDPITVRIHLRSLDRAMVTNAALVHLLPGGFEVVEGSLRADLAGCEHVELREDRAVLFTAVGRSARTITFQIKATCRGEFVVPPALVESMYEPGVHGRSSAGKIVVTE